jgi:hypothetical protein
MHDSWRYASDVTSASALALVNPHEWIHRVDESVEPVDDVLRRRITMNFTIPVVGDAEHTTAIGKRPFVIPLMFAVRDQTIDNLKVQDAAGTALPILCHGEHEHFAGRLLEAIALQEGDVDVSELSDAANTALSKLAEIPRKTKGDAEEIVSEFFSGSRPQDTVVVKMWQSAMLYEYARTFSELYLVLVEVSAEPGERRLITYSYDSQYSEQALKIRDKVRRWFNQRPYSFRLPVPQLDRCESYHFEMAAPAGYFVAKQQFVTTQGGAAAGTAAERASLMPKRFPAGVLYVGGEQVGLPRAHLYVGGARRGTNPKYLWARVIFYERPLGSLGLSLALAALTGATLLVFLLNSTALVNNEVKHTLDDTPALLLALPGAAIVWLRSVNAQANFLQAPLRASFLFTATGAASFAAAVSLAVARLEAGAAGRGWLVWLWIGLIVGLVLLSVPVILGLWHNARRLAKGLKSRPLIGYH